MKTRPDEAVIVALGDSLTAGWLVSRGYPEFLGELLAGAGLAARVIAAGFPGETARDGLGRLSLVASHTPYAVIIQYALNDLFMGYSTGDFRAAMESIIIQVRGWGAHPVLMTSVPLPPGSEAGRLEEFYGAIEELSRKFALPIARFDLLLAEAMQSDTCPDRYFLDDGIHPDEEGYRIMAEAAFEAVSRLLLPENNHEKR